MAALAEIIAFLLLLSVLLTVVISSDVIERATFWTPVNFTLTFLK